MIIQLGALLGGLATGLGGIIRAAAPQLLEVGGAFLQRELTRKDRRRQQRQVQAQAVAALNTPGIAVSRLGGTVQPVGGRVQRSTFTPAAFTPAQSPFGNVPLLPVGGFLPRGPVPMIPGPFAGFGTMIIPPLPGGTPVAIGQARGQGPLGLQFSVNGVGPKFSKDEFGRTIMFVPSPTGSGFISVQQARASNLSAMKPWWRFNRVEGQFEKISPRRMNPFNFKAAARAGRRIERTLDAVKNVVRIARKKDKGVSAGHNTVVSFKTKKRKK